MNEIIRHMMSTIDIDGLDKERTLNEVKEQFTTSNNTFTCGDINTLGDLVKKSLCKQLEEL
jgi:hypothetical protein